MKKNGDGLFVVLLRQEIRPPSGTETAGQREARPLAPANRSHGWRSARPRAGSPQGDGTPNPSPIPQLENRPTSGDHKEPTTRSLSPAL